MFKVINPFLFILLFSSTAFSQVVLIDPGHGGKDCGAKARIWNKSKTTLKLACEKDLALSIAKKIHKKLSKNFHSYLTRSVDRDVSLHERALLAEKISADIFISIHINSSKSKRSHGFETFYLDNHNNKAVGKIENVENKGAHTKDFVINSILADLVIERTAPQSRKLATYIHANLTNRIPKKYKLTDRGAKAALFYVLALSKRPAVLLEVGFLSNPKELRKIMSPQFQEEYATAVYLGVRRYFKGKKKVNLF